jgi:putative transposase
MVIKHLKIFSKKKSSFPKYKKKQNQDVKAYFPKNNKTDWTVERHRINIPTIGWIRLKEFGYIPSNVDITGGAISIKANRYYVSVTVKAQPEEQDDDVQYVNGIGIDLGLKDFAITSDNRVFKNLNKTSIIKRVEKKLKREQRSLSRKFEYKKKRGETSATRRGSNIEKNILRLQKLHVKLANMREAYRSSVASMLVKTKPAYITIEDLNVNGMLKNRYLSKSVSNQGFYDFKLKLLNACNKFEIELREVPRFYPSSKLCSFCGHKKVDLSLSDRIFECENCNGKLDRDLNAAINLKLAREYVVLT